MRKQIFTDDSGRTPDLRFAGERFECRSAAARRHTCTVEGTLQVRGVTKPFAITLVVKEDGGAFRVSGSGTVRLSDYGIGRPAQLGVSTANEVTLSFDLVARAGAPRIGSSQTGASRIAASPIVGVRS
jgi:hypothetical protein